MDRAKRRVKVYQLNTDGQWDDKGTGHVTCLEKQGSYYLSVKSEIDNNILLESKIQSSDTYQRQQETLIVWNEPETSEDLALSFQESDGCDEIWSQVQRLEDEKREPVILPQVTLFSLDKIMSLFTNPNNIPSEKEDLVNAITSQGLIKNLLNLFHNVEPSQDLVALRKIFEIFKSLVLLNDYQIFEVLFNEDNFLQVLGALEYDPELPTSLRHREYLQNKSLFKEVVPITDKELLKKIHQTFRVQYLRDTVLPRVLDDPTFSALSTIIYLNQHEILLGLQKDEKFLTELFTKIQTEKDYETLKELGRFLQDFCGLAKILQVPARLSFFNALSTRGLLGSLEILLSFPEASNNVMRLSGLDIINSILNHDCSMLRKFILSQKPNFGLMEKLVTLLIKEKDTGLTGQVAEILRTLLDTEIMTDLAEKNDFLTMFYSEEKSFVKQLIEVLRQKENPSISLVCELLGFCVQHHNHRMKVLLKSQKILEKISKLLNNTEKHVALAALRFIRVLVGLKEPYAPMLLKTNTLDHVMEAFIQNGPRYNLLNSSIIEIFEAIRKDNIKPLIEYLVEKYETDFKRITYVETFQNLILKYEQNKEKPLSDSENSNQKKRRLVESDDDSHYFRESDDDDEPTPSLVAYEDDDISPPSTSTSTLTPNETESEKSSPDTQNSKDESEGESTSSTPSTPKRTRGGVVKEDHRDPSDEESDISDKQPKRLKVG